MCRRALTLVHLRGQQQEHALAVAQRRPHFAPRALGERARRGNATRGCPCGRRLPGRRRAAEPPGRKDTKAGDSAPARTHFRRRVFRRKGTAAARQGPHAESGHEPGGDARGADGCTRGQDTAEWPPPLACRQRHFLLVGDWEGGEVCGRPAARHNRGYPQIAPCCEGYQSGRTQRAHKRQPSNDARGGCLDTGLRAVSAHTSSAATARVHKRNSSAATSRVHHHGCAVAPPTAL